MSYAVVISFKKIGLGSPDSTVNPPKRKQRKKAEAQQSHGLMPQRTTQVVAQQCTRSHSVTGLRRDLYLTSACVACAIDPPADMNGHCYKIFLTLQAFSGRLSAVSGCSAAFRVASSNDPSTETPSVLVSDSTCVDFPVKVSTIFLRSWMASASPSRSCKKSSLNKRIRRMGNDFYQSKSYVFHYNFP